MRFNNGEIGKVIDIKENPSRIVYSEYGEIGLISDIAKHSKQLIDLIECGDYVNGELITDKWVTRISSTKSNFSEEDIKTILTKESYMANCYKIGGEDEKI